MSDLSRAPRGLAGFVALLALAAIAAHAELLVDTRGRYPKARSHIVKA